MSDEKIRPLSSAQLRLWLLDRLESGRTAHTTCRVVRMPGSVRGKHQAPFMRLAATNRSIAFFNNVILRVADGRVTELRASSTR